MTKIVLNLPMPPSTNELWRSHRGRVHISAVYKAWIAEAGLTWLLQKKDQPKRLPGNFKAVLVLNQEQRGMKDCDNRSKAALDFCKTHGLIFDDRLCDAI